MNGINIDLFDKNQKKRLFIYLIILIFVIGIALRSYGITLRVFFLDEAVHYGFIHELWKSQPYKYTELIKTTGIKTLNESLHIYNNLKYNLTEKEHKRYFILPDISYSLAIPPSISLINLSVQPYYYLKHLAKNNSYRYDPVYHGPFQYYLGDLVFNLAGEHSKFLMRLPMVVSSILVLFFILLFREHLGKFGLILSLAVVSVSPALVYFSNLANYENYVATFTLLGVGLLLLGIKKRSPWILFLSGIVLLVLITVKETALVSWFCIVIATIMTYITVYLKDRPSYTISKLENIFMFTIEGKYNKEISRYLFPALLCFLVGVAIFAVLYSSFGANPTGIHDGLTSWMYWKHTGSQSGHVKEFGYYTDLVLKYDFGLVFLFAIGSIITLFSTRDKYKLFIIFWALLNWLVYSLIPYKTPWLIINFLIPFAVAAGVSWNIIFNMFENKVYKYLMVFFVCLLSINAFFTAYTVKWIDYDKESNALTYVHTYRDFEEEVKAIYSLTLSSPKGYSTEISIAAPEYWPLPAYLFDYNSIGYFGGIKGRDLNINAPIIINDRRDNPELTEYLLESDRSDFIKLRTFKLRPGVDHTIFVSKELFDRYISTNYYRMLINPGKMFLLDESSRN